MSEKKPIDPYSDAKIPIGLQFKYAMNFILMHIFQKNKKLTARREQLRSQIQSKLPSYKDDEFFEVQRISNLSEEEFKEFVKKDIPVIFDQESINWDSTKKWNFQFLLDKYGDCEIDLVNREGLIQNEHETFKDGDTILIKDFIKQTEKKEESHYLRFCRLMEFFPELQYDMDLKWLKKMRQCFFGYSYQTFLGAIKKVTPWHCGSTAFFFIMVDGEKEWHLYPADRYSLMNPPDDGYGYFYSEIDDDIENKKFVKPYKCTLKKGDILFIPAWMWHKVENLSDSWGVSYRFVNLRGIIKRPTFGFIRLFLTNPSFVRIMFNALSKNPNKKFNITPRLFGK